MKYKQTFFTSDPHLQHRFVSKLRGFGDDVDAHDATIATNWDRVVVDGDDVWVVGDLTISQLDYALEWVSQRPGTKHFVAGNHDSCHPMHRRWTRAVRRYLEVFETVQSLASVRLEGHTVQISHFPYGAKEGADHTLEPRYLEWRPRESDLWLIHGHTHNAAQRYHDRQVHVGLDAWDMQLVSQHDVARFIRENP